MNKTTILNELYDIYKNLKGEADFKAAINILKLIAQLKNFFDKPKDLKISDLSDQQLNELLIRIEASNHGLC